MPNSKIQDCFYCDANQKWIYQAHQTNNNMGYNPKVNTSNCTTKPHNITTITSD